MNIANNAFLSIEQVKEQYLEGSKQTRRVQNQEGLSFGQILERKQELVFSKHAQNRLSERNIDLTEEQIDRLKQGTQKATQKGIQESLVLVDNLAFIVNIKNNTVITAMDQTESNENIFTNIDGAVIN